MKAQLQNQRLRLRMRKRSSSSTVWRTTAQLLIDALRFVSLGLRSRSQLAAENLFLRKQLALYQECRVAPRRADDATRIALVVLCRLTDGRAILTIVKPDPLSRWHREERLIGTIRRECLDWLIIVNERHLRSILKEWVAHYNRGRPHASLGPGIPDVPSDEAKQPSNGHRIPDGHRVVAVPILAGLHHEYGLAPEAA